jgi:ppGpp synthetase/RelA/SpoT-type nucleotidyltranferase
MPRSSPKKDPVIEFIDSCFPEESHPKQLFIRMLESVTKDHELFLGAVIGWLYILVENLKKSVNKPSHSRFICKLDPSNKKKNWYSVADKLWRESQKKPPKYNLQNFHKIMADLVRLRVVCNFLSDIKSFESALSKDYGSDMSKQKAFSMNKTDDSIKQRPKDRKSGHRSIKYLFKSKDFFSWFQVPNTCRLFWIPWA